MGKKIRLIARLDVKDTNLVKGIQLEGLRKLVGGISAHRVATTLAER